MAGKRPVMTRTKPAEQRRAELLAAGGELFLAKGIAATSLEDITQRAGVSKGLFYLYFRSKEDMVLALQEQFSCQVAACVRTAAEGPAGWTVKLDACVRASFECYRDLHDLHEVLFRHGPTAGRPAEQEREQARAQQEREQAQHGPSHAAAVQVFAELFAAGTAAGAFDVADPETTAVLCYASMHAFDRGFRGHAGPDDHRLIQAAQQLFRRAAGAETRAAGAETRAAGAETGSARPAERPDAPA
jgi:AcrR family transcriptional regulator